MTAGGIAIWAGLGLRSATLPTRMGIYYIAIGAGLAILGNLVWRVLCEIWTVLFDINNLLGSIVSESRHVPVQLELPDEEHRVELRRDKKSLILPAIGKRVRVGGEVDPLSTD